MIKLILILLLIVVVFVLFSFTSISQVLNLSFLSSFVSSLSFIPDFFSRAYEAISSYQYILYVFTLFLVPFVVITLFSIIFGGSHDKKD